VSESLATGPALAARLAGLQVKLIGGEVPRPLGQSFRVAVDKLEARYRRYLALERVIMTIQADNPDLSLWQCCGELEARLGRFHDILKRIEKGRPVKGEYEQDMVMLLTIDGPKCQEKTFKLLTDTGQ